MKTNFLDDVRSFLEFFLTKLELAWWIEMLTDNPSCLYYFGPFLSRTEAKSHVIGYLEDLQQEEAQIIVVDIKRYQPKILRVCQGNLW
jgi:hypothetical protein